MTEIASYPVRFLLVHPNSYDPDTLLVDVLTSIYDEEDTPGDRVRQVYRRACDDSRILYGVEVTFSGPPDEARASVAAVAEALGDAAKSSEDGLDHALKFSDPLLLRDLQERSAYLFEVEMQLREALSAALLTRHPDRHNLLTAAEVKAQPKGQPKGRSRGVLYHEALENETFYLDFAGYHEAVQRKESASAFVLRSAREAADFADFQGRLAQGPIRGEPFDILLGLLDGPIEDITPVRNAAAHNRTASSDAVFKFNARRAEIEASLDQFFTDLDESP